MKNKEKYSVKNIILFVVLTVLSLILSYLIQPCINQNAKAVDLIVTVFSILAGFLVAIITIIGDPSALYPGSWRISFYQKEQIITRLNRHKILFHAYLITLALIFVSYIIENLSPVVLMWTERGYIFIGLMAFFYSLLLPGSLTKIQQERVDAIISERRKAAGIQEDKKQN